MSNIYQKRNGSLVEVPVQNSSPSLAFSIGTVKGLSSNADPYATIENLGTNLFQLNLGIPFCPSTSYSSGVTNYFDIEMVIGKWIDGRPIYRKCVEATTSPVTFTNNEIYDATDLNIDKIINLYGSVCIDSSCSSYCAINTFNSNSLNSNDYHNCVYYSNGKFLENHAQAVGSGVYIVIIFEYVKTDDTPLEDNTVVIGITPSGKTIYRTVITGSIESSGFQSINIENLSYDEIVNISGTYRHTETNGFIPINCVDLITSSSNPGYVCCYKGGSALKIGVCSNWVGGTYFINIDYTKV